MPARGIASVFATIVGLASAQTPTPTPTPAKPEAPTPLQRAANDAVAACRRLDEATFAFSGTCGLTGPMVQRALKDVTFLGAHRDHLESFTVGDHHILRHGDHEVVSTAKGAWTRPQGDSPDCPFAPRVLAAHIGSGTIDEFVPTDVGGRPAIRVHVAWRGAAAAAIVSELHHPSSTCEGLLEAIANRIEKTVQNPDVTLEASVWIDPASRRVYAATMRLLFVPNPAVPEPAKEASTERDADGLHPAPDAAMLLGLWRITLDHDAARVVMPELSTETRKLLDWPRADVPKPSADAKPAIK